MKFDLLQLDMSYCVLSLIFISIINSVLAVTDLDTTDDLLLPYPEGLHGSHRGHRFVRECQPNRFGNLTHEEWPTQYDDYVASTLNLAEVRYFARKVGTGNNRRTVYGHHVIVNNPNRTTSVVEPRESGGCHLHYRETVTVSAMAEKCVIAVNAGFFNITDGACLGNVISDGRLAHDADGIQNAHFGIKENGNLFFGYIPENEITKQSFTNLVGGVLWLVRNGQSYVDVSKVSECPDAQSTSTLQGFIDAVSARTAVGHDRLGRLVIVQVDGRTWDRGITLYEFTELLLSFGIINAINLDGGGSATLVVNGTVVNYPSDTRKMNNISYGIARNVSTIICIHDILCDPVDCSGHGHCHRGHCYCQENWHGSQCDVLQCGLSNCSGHGSCSSDGCQCYAGWHGLNCSVPCPAGHYGVGCSGECQCPNQSAGCSPVDGHCLCPPGYRGYYCESQCLYGTYGEGCRNKCHCYGGCFCDHVTGNCYHTDSMEWQVGQCFADMIVVSRRTAILTSDEYWLWLCGVMSLAVISVVSITGNVVCCVQKCKHGRNRKSRKHRSRQKVVVSPLDDSSTSELDSDNEYYRRKFGSVSSNRLSRNYNLSHEIVPLTQFSEDHNDDEAAMFTNDSPSVWS